MNEPKFTSGPWKAGKNPYMTTILDGHEVKAIYPDESSYHIAWANAENSDGDLDIETALANAALISAAPEMYWFIEHLTTVTGHALLSQAGYLGESLYNEAIELCRKARGESEDGK